MADWTILPRDRRDALGEGIAYVPREDALYWVDILGRRLHRFGLGDAAWREWILPEMTGWVIERRNGDGFVAGMKSGFHRLRLDPLRIELLASPEPELPFNRMNDACADAQGRIWAGTMSLDGSRSDGSLYRFDPDGTWQRMDAPYAVANGPAISADGTTLWHTDSARRLVYRFALHDDGSLGPRTVFLEFPDGWGAPDGMTIDAEGGLWIAHWGGGCVSRFDPRGRRERWIDLPASQITRPCFGGADFSRLFVTSAADGVDEEWAGAVFEVDPGVRGLAAMTYAG